MPDNLAVGAFLDGVQSDVKRNFDRLHETALNHLEDMKSIAAENVNLVQELKEARARAQSAHDDSIFRRVRLFLRLSRDNIESTTPLRFMNMNHPLRAVVFK